MFDHRNPPAHESQVGPLERVQTKYDELEAVVKVVYPEVIPEVGCYTHVDPWL